MTNPNIDLTPLETIDLDVDDYRVPCSIVDAAREAGLTTVDLITTTGQGDACVALWDIDGVYAISTNASSVWRDNDPEEFQLLWDELFGLTVTTYRIEILDADGWVPAPGEATGWTLDEARFEVAYPMYHLDGTVIDPELVRIVDERTGQVVEYGLDV